MYSWKKRFDHISSVRSFVWAGLDRLPWHSLLHKIRRTGQPWGSLVAQPFTNIERGDHVHSTPCYISLLPPPHTRLHCRETAARVSSGSRLQCLPRLFVPRSVSLLLFLFFSSLRRHLMCFERILCLLLFCFYIFVVSYSYHCQYCIFNHAVCFWASNWLRYKNNPLTSVYFKEETYIWWRKCNTTLYKSKHLSAVELGSVSFTYRWFTFLIAHHQGNASPSYVSMFLSVSARAPHTIFTLRLSHASTNATSIRSQWPGQSLWITNTWRELLVFGQV